MKDSAPLAFRLRPTTLDAFIGQEHAVGEGTALRTAIENDSLHSVILAGPPGTGKTTLAKIIAEKTRARFVQINAVLSGVKELRDICSDADRLFAGLRQRTVLFIDEIHRFNKAQQDALLPYVESGTVILIGATTANPYFEVNAALVSRSQVHLFQPLTVEDLSKILTRALGDPEGYAEKVKMTQEAIAHIATVSNGDARIALNLLEMAVLTIGSNLTERQIEDLFKERNKRYDRAGEEHYDTISAFIKSMRGSDCDAALLWMFKMLGSGEEPRFLFRRMMIFASEDIGNADPRALQLVVSAWQAFELVGLPEGEFFLAHACVYLAQAPKSNAVTRAKDAAKAVRDAAAALEVPLHLRNAPVKAMRTDHGYGRGYRNPHDEPQTDDGSRDAPTTRSYFPIGMKQQIFYEPNGRGFEGEVVERLRRIRQIVGR